MPGKMIFGTYLTQRPATYLSIIILFLSSILIVLHVKRKTANEVKDLEQMIRVVNLWSILLTLTTLYLSIPGLSNYSLIFLHYMLGIRDDPA